VTLSSRAGRNTFPPLQVAERSGKKMDFIFAAPFAFSRLNFFSLPSLWRTHVECAHLFLEVPSCCLVGMRPRVYVHRANFLKACYGELNGAGLALGLFSIFLFWPSPPRPEGLLLHPLLFVRVFSLEQSLPSFFLRTPPSLPLPPS